MKLEDSRIAIFGLGYVGLPLAVEFGKYFDTYGFDIDHTRISELHSKYDRTLELTSEQISDSTYLRFTSDTNQLNECNVFIVTVPTPIDEHKNPNTKPLVNATKTISKIIKQGDTVVYESTVYPGATEEICVPILEEGSGLSYNTDFFCGYSPERINPGDKKHTLTKITKVTSGSCIESAEFVDNLYSKIIDAGTYRASSIKVAEAAKVIENTQRDLNIALVNELSIIFSKLGIPTQDVLDAASTKWNFLNFKPGLVGGHCIGVDPYYLTHKAQSIGHYPEIILAGRRLNDSMPSYSSHLLIKHMIKSGMKISDSNVLILGVTFKENCPDIRNTKVVEMVNELRNFEVNVDLHDPWADPEEFTREYNLSLNKRYIEKHYDSIVLAVPHSKYINSDGGLNVPYDLTDKLIFDLKSALENRPNDLKL